MIGASISFELANTTSAFVTLRNKLSEVSNPRETTKIEARTIYIYSVQDNEPPSSPVSLLIQIDQDSRVHFDQNGHGTLEIASSLDQERSHHIKITYLASKQGEEGTLEFEGIWLDKGGQLISDETNWTTPILGSPPTSSARPHFEIISPLPMEDPNSLTTFWPSLLASHFNTTYTIFPASTYHLTPIDPQNHVLLSDLYFRSGPPSTQYFQLPHRFPSPFPSALIVDVGLLDFQIFLADDPSTHAIKQYISTFIGRYTTFISTIRASAYPYHSPHLTNRYDMIAVDASFTYNSAPSTLPIFLLTPFTPSKRLQRLLSHAVAEVVNMAQRAGDKSTFWLDTSGWLSKDDFKYDLLPNGQSKRQDTTAPTQPTQPFTLTPQAHSKIASHLSQHLCPYLSSPALSPSASHPSTDEEQNPTFPNDSALTINKECPFNKHDNYLGHLYVPAEAGMGKALEERKIELVRKLLGLESRGEEVLA